MIADTPFFLRRRGTTVLDTLKREYVGSLCVSEGKELVLYINNLGPEEARFIAEGLKGLEKLKRLTLSNNNLGPEGARFIVEGLKGLGVLERLYLGNNNWGSEGARFITEGLKELGKLMLLYLNNNNLGSEGARFIVEGIKGLGKLRFLYLDSNNLGSEGAKFIAEGLKGLGKLRGLSLSNNDLGPEGAKFIAEGLKGLGKLEKLWLHKNNLGLGVWFLSEGLAHGVWRRELTSSVSSQGLYIDLSDNLLDSTCLSALLPIALLRDEVRVYFKRNFFDEETQSALRESGFEVAAQSIPSSSETAKIQEIGEWVQGFPGYQQQVRLYQARDSGGFREMENGVRFGVDDFGGLVDVLGGGVVLFPARP